MEAGVAKRGVPVARKPWDTVLEMPAVRRSSFGRRAFRRRLEAGAEDGRRGVWPRRAAPATLDPAGPRAGGRKRVFEAVRGRRGAVPGWFVAWWAVLGGLLLVVGLGWASSRRLADWRQGLLARLVEAGPEARAGADRLHAALADRWDLAPAVAGFPEALARAAEVAGIAVTGQAVLPPRAVGACALRGHVLAFSGDPYDLPVLVDAAIRLRRPVLVAELAAVGEGGAVRGVLRLVTVEPRIPGAGQAGRVARRIDPDAPPRLLSAVGAGLELRAWRRFAVEVARLGREAERRRLALARDLPARLVALRRHGGRLAWTPPSPPSRSPEDTAAVADGS